MIRLRVADVMSTRLFTVPRDTSLRDVQHLMKKEGITGVPIAEDRRVYGMISVDDIINALDCGYIDDPAHLHMTRNVVVLEEHLPLTLAVSSFQNYSYGRFPVVDKTGLLVGVISSRDILTKMLVEINKEVDRLENLIPTTETSQPKDFHREFVVKQYDLDTAGIASGTVKKHCTSQGIDPRTCRRIAVAVYELEVNLAIHSVGGVLTCSLRGDSFRVVSRDNGPGIQDVDRAMTEAYTTAVDWVKALGFGAGMGLPNVKRVSDDFTISSTLHHGTVVTATIYLPGKEMSTDETT